MHPFSEVLIWFKALRDLVQVQTKREILAPQKSVTVDEPIMTSKEKSMRLVESDPTPGAANNGDPSVAVILPADEGIGLDGHASHNDTDMEIDQGSASSSS